MDNICRGRVSDPGGTHRCSYSGKVERDGKWYCRIHDPVAKAERNAAQDAVWQEKREQYNQEIAERQAKRQRRERLADCAEELLAALEATIPWLESMRLPVQDQPLRDKAAADLYAAVTAVAHAKGQQEAQA